MSDCSNHKKDVAGISDMKRLAEMIGDLHYGTLEEFMRQLAIKINNDSVRDINSGRLKLGQSLYHASCYLEAAWVAITECWLISKSFMK